MKEFLNSFAEYFAKRAKSQVYGIFAFWWLAFHWSFFYSLFFLDQKIILQKTGMLKDAYLRDSYFDLSSVYFWFSLVSSFLMTYLTIWWFPKLLLKAYKKEKDDDYDKQMIKVEYDKKVEKLKTKLEEQKIEKLEVTTERVQKEQAVENLEVSQWEQEYRQFKRSEIFASFQSIINSMYEYNGYIKSEYNDYSGKYDFVIPSDVLVFSHTNGLILLDRDNGTIELTDKGKFFIRKYLVDKTGI